MTPAPGIAAVAVAARQALGCAGVVVTRTGPTAAPTVLAADGIRAEDLRAVWPALLRAEAGDAADRDDEAHAWRPLLVDGTAVGGLHALGTLQRPVVRAAALLDAFAGHISILVAHRRLTHRADTLAARLERSEALERIGLPCDDPAEVIHRIERTVAPLLGRVRAGVCLADDDGQVLELVPGSFGASGEMTAAYQIDLHDLRSTASRVFRLRRPYVSNDVDADPAMLQPYSRAFGIRRVIAVPLIVAGRTLGVLSVVNGPRPFTADDVACCEELAPRVGTVLEHLRTATRLRREHRIDRVVSDATVALAAGAAPDEVLDDALEGMRTVLTASAVAFVRQEGAPRIARSGLDPAAEADLLRQARTSEWTHADTVVRAPAGRSGHAVFHTPVRLGGRSVGMLCARRERAWAFRADEQHGLVRLATVAALSLAADEYHDQRAALARIHERHRIADDLHDDVAQLLFAAQMQLDSLLELDGVAGEVAERARTARAHLVRADTAMRAVITELSPARAGANGERLREVVAEVAAQFGVVADVVVAPGAAPLLAEGDPELAELVLKVAREAVVNAAKHAGPCRVDVVLEPTGDGAVRLEIHDDGVGVPDTIAREGHGLAAMRRNVGRHGGTLHIGRAPAGGTAVRVDLPVAVRA